MNKLLIRTIVFLLAFSLVVDPLSASAMSASSVALRAPFPSPFFREEALASTAAWSRRSLIKSIAPARVMVATYVMAFALGFPSSLVSQNQTLEKAPDQTQQTQALTFIEKMRDLKAIPELKDFHFPNIGKITERQRVLDGMEIIQQYARSKDDDNNALTYLLESGAADLNIIKGNPNAFADAIQGAHKRDPHNVGYTFYYHPPRQGKIRFFIVLDPNVFNDMPFLISILGHEIIGHAANGLRLAPKETDKQRENLAGADTVNFLKWIVRHDHLSPLTDKELKLIRTIRLPEQERQWNNYGGPVPDSSPHAIHNEPDQTGKLLWFLIASLGMVGLAANKENGSLNDFSSSDDDELRDAVREEWVHGFSLSQIVDMTEHRINYVELESFLQGHPLKAKKAASLKIAFEKNRSVLKKPTLRLAREEAMQETRQILLDVQEILDEFVEKVQTPMLTKKILLRILSGEIETIPIGGVFALRRAAKAIDEVQSDPIPLAESLVSDIEKYIAMEWIPKWVNYAGHIVYESIPLMQNTLPLLQTQPGDIQKWKDMAIAYQALEDHKSELNAYLAIVVLEPSDIENWRYLGAVLGYLGYFRASQDISESIVNSGAAPTDDHVASYWKKIQNLQAIDGHILPSLPEDLFEYAKTMPDYAQETTRPLSRSHKAGFHGVGVLESTLLLLIPSFVAVGFLFLPGHLRTLQTALVHLRHAWQIFAASPFALELSSAFFAFPLMAHLSHSKNGKRKTRKLPVLTAGDKPLLMKYLTEWDSTKYLKSASSEDQKRLQETGAVLLDFLKSPALDLGAFSALKIAGEGPRTLLLPDWRRHMQAAKTLHDFNVLLIAALRSGWVTFRNNLYTELTNALINKKIKTIWDEMDERHAKLLADDVNTSSDLMENATHILTASASPLHSFTSKTTPIQATVTPEDNAKNVLKAYIDLLTRFEKNGLLQEKAKMLVELGWFPLTYHHRYINLGQVNGEPIRISAREFKEEQILQARVKYDPQYEKCIYLEIEGRTKDGTIKLLAYDFKRIANFFLMRQKTQSLIKDEFINRLIPPTRIRTSA